jgi:MFS transporter, NNP family, nitrate/nitrite transporter
MTTTGQHVTPQQVARKPGRWIQEWRPEDGTFWERGGSRVARRNPAKRRARWCSGA